MDDIARQRHMRRLNVAIYRADLTATGAEHHQLLALKHAVRLGHLHVEDAIRAVNALRSQRAA